MNTFKLRKGENCARNGGKEICDAAENLNKTAQNASRKKAKSKGRAVTLSITPTALIGGITMGQLVVIITIASCIVVAGLAFVLYKIISRKQKNKCDNVTSSNDAKGEQPESLTNQPESSKKIEASESTKNLESENLNEAAATETCAKEIQIDENLTITDEDGEVKEVVRGIDKLTGMAIIVRYNRSFTARLAQSSDENKAYYSSLKNEILSYKKANSRISWNCDSINAGREIIAKFVIRGKTLCLYLALNANDYNDSKYKVEAVDSKRYGDVPCLYRIKNDRRAKYAKELIADVAAKYNLEKQERVEENYYIPYETTEELIAKGLIKELVSEQTYEQFMQRRSRSEVDKNIRRFVTAAEVNSILSDDVAQNLVEVAQNRVSVSGKKGIINIDELNANYAQGDSVTLESLKSKGLVASNVGYVKVLARGELDKKLIVELNDYSLQAVKMILLTGGRAIKV
jgi:hypothetical protein